MGNIADELELPVGCAHHFVQERWKFRDPGVWVCRSCSLRTRRYNGVDQLSMRPIHRHMSVALPGFNATIQGLNRAIASVGWIMFAKRLQDRIGEAL